MGSVGGVTRILVGDARDQLGRLADGSVHCVVTSPPYWGLRSYDEGTHGSGMIGLEPTFGEHVDNLLGVFSEVWRVLRDDGTVWLNYGDAYVAHWSSVGDARRSGMGEVTNRERGRNNTGLPPKNLMMMPARVAMALQDAGWFLRSEIVWHKPNPMPESAKDRPTSAHEKLFLLSKRPRYFYDDVAVRTERIWPADAGGQGPRRAHDDGDRGMRDRKSDKMPDGWDTSEGAHGSVHRDGREKGRKSDKQRGHSRRHEGFNGRWDQMTKDEQQAGGANLRNVWPIATAPFSGVHFATFPPKLVEPCIKAGTSEHGVCSECGAPWQRNVDTEYVNPGGRTTNGPRSLEQRSETAGFEQRLESRTVTVGWEPGCGCDAERVAAVVLDPFGGSGTVGMVAARLGRDAVLCELSAGYAEMAADRITGDGPLLNTVVID